MPPPRMPTRRGLPVRVAAELFIVTCLPAPPSCSDSETNDENGHPAHPGDPLFQKHHGQHSYDHVTTAEQRKSIREFNFRQCHKPEGSGENETESPQPHPAGAQQTRIADLAIVGL